jgi:hypothetical protein
MSKRVVTLRLILLSIFLSVSAFAGCERKERVIDVRTPGANVKVDRNVDNGNIEVKTERK